MLLSKKSLLEVLKTGYIIGFGEPVKTLPAGQQQSASLNLTIGKIFEPAMGKKVQKSDDIQKLGDDAHSINPGEMVIVQVEEHFNMPLNMGGVLFCPNRLSKKGLLMTNPGHIDPGFKGYTTVCLVNMGRQPIELKAADPIVRLLVFQTDHETPGYDREPATGVDHHQLNTLDKDFAGLNKRLPGAISDYIALRAGLTLGVIGLVFAAYALLIPELSKYRLAVATENQIAKEMFIPFKNEVLLETIEERVKLEKKVKKLNLMLDSLCKETGSKACTELN